MGTSTPLLGFLRERLETGIWGIDQLQQARGLYLSAAARTATTEKEGFLRFVCAITLHNKEVEAATIKAKQHEQHQPQHQHQQPQQQEEQQQQHFDLLNFSLPQSACPSLLKGLIKQSLAIPSAAGNSSSSCTGSNSSSSNSCFSSSRRVAGALEGRPPWLRVSDSMELIGSLLSHVAEAAQVCSNEQTTEKRDKETEIELTEEKCKVVITLVRLLCLYQQQRVLAVLAAKKTTDAAGGGGPREPPEGAPKPQPGDGEIWQLLRWSINTTMLLKALANLTASAAAARKAAVEANGEEDRA